jgi:serine/threonine-protein kinase
MWSRFSVLLDGALELPPSEHASWLAQLRGEDATLKPMLARVLSNAPGIETDYLRAQPKLAPEAPFAPGLMVGPYLLISRLGEGGMGEVWRAARDDDGPRRNVALKLPHAELLGGPFRQRFARERDVLAALSHPHIAQLYDAGSSADGHPYLALELVEGQPIAQACRSACASLERRIDLVIQVLEGLAYAHQRLIVHRDIKPSNVLVTPAGHAKLLDFGIAKMLGVEGGGDSTLTQPQARLATPAYAAPEQLAGGAITVGTDVFAVGVLLFELCTGQLPFVRVPNDVQAPAAPLASQRANAAAAGMMGESSSFLKKRTKKLLFLKRSPGSPSLDRRPARGIKSFLLLFFKKEGLSSRLRGDLDAIIAKAISLDPAARYASAESFAADLRRWRSQMPVQARRIGWLARAQKFVRRNKLGVGLGTVLTVAIASGTAGVAWQAHRAEQQAARADAIKDFLKGLFHVTYPHGNSRNSASVTARDLLDIGADSADAAFGSDPATEVELLQTLGEIYDGMLTESTRAERVWTRRVDLLRTLYGPADKRVVDAAVDLAGSEIIATHYEKAKALLEQLRVPVLQRYGPDSTEWAQWLAMRARALRATHGARDEVIADTKAALAILAHGNDVLDMESSLGTLAGAQFAAEQYQEAAATWQRLRTLNNAAAESSGLVELMVLTGSGDAMAKLGALRAADGLYTAAAAQADRQTGRHSDWYLTPVTHRAEMLDLQGQARQAEAIFRDVLADANGSRTVRRRYAAMLVRQGRGAGAVPVLEAELAANLQLPQIEDNTRTTQALLADAYDQAGRTEAARAMLLASRAEWLRFGLPNGADTLGVRVRWARFLFDHNEPDAASAECHEILRAAGGAASAPAASAQAELARIALARGDYPGADRLSAQAMQTIDAVTIGYDVRARTDIWLTRAETLLATGQKPQAKDLAARALAAARSSDAPTSARLARALEIVGKTG